MILRIILFAGKCERAKSTI